jgi:hypothetical protein
MDISSDEISGFMGRPSEGLNREIKRWIDPTKSEGITKIVRACFALRNRNGGFLLVGFDNNTLQPDANPPPGPVLELFHVDRVQEIISKYASEPFEVAVGFGERGTTKYPIIKVDEGVRSPVAVKKDLKNDGGGYLLREGEVYFRTLNSNGVASSARAKWKDWPQIVEICFENREADIGRFFRRHLSGKEIGALVGALTGDASRLNTAEEPKLPSKTTEFLDFGATQFQSAVEARQISETESAALTRGMWKIALVVDPQKSGMLPDRDFLNTALSANPELTGWPIWLDSRGFSDRDAAPRVRDDAWETLILSLEDDGMPYLDFMRLDPRGKFYLQRILEDDLKQKPQPGTVLDPIIVIIRVAEAIAVALRMVTSLGWGADARLGFAFEWSKLDGRRLSTWANPLAMFFRDSASSTATVRTYVEIPVNTPVSAIAPYVQEAIDPLFVTFDGYRIQASVVENWTQRLIERRLYA